MSQLVKHIPCGANCTDSGRIRMVGWDATDENSLFVPEHVTRFGDDRPPACSALSVRRVYEWVITLLSLFCTHLFGRLLYIE